MRRWPPIAGETLYHGTASEEEFEHDSDAPDGPAWFSDSASVARRFSRWHYRPGSSPRVLLYRVTQDPELFVWEYEAQMDELLGENWRDMAVPELADAICDAGYDGWIIPHNYPDGADIMLCEPSDFLSFQSTEAA